MLKINFMSTLFVATSFANNQPDTEELAGLILDCLHTYPGFTTIVAALESTSVYSIHIANFLSTCELLMPYRPYIMYEPLNVSLVSSFNCINTCRREIKVIDKAIEKTILGITPNSLTILQSILGISPVWAAGIIAEVGGTTAFHSSDALAKYAGLTWPRNQSGSFEAEDTSLTKTGNSYLRCYLGEAANSVRRHIPEYQE